MRCISCCFQNVVINCLNSTNPIDKVNFIVKKTKRLFNFFEKKCSEKNLKYIFSVFKYLIFSCLFVFC